MITETQKLVLLLTSASLFNHSIEAPKSIDWEEIRKESCEQTVHLAVFEVCEKALPEDSYQSWKKMVSRTIANNMRVSYEHCEAAELMRKNNIPHVFLKGMASASYYQSPEVRVLGDVDVLVEERYLTLLEKVLGESGFSSEKDQEGIHVAFHRPPNSNWEIHRDVNGIPNGRVGEKCREYLADIIETAVVIDTVYGKIRVPDTFHHGLVLLLHTASHLTAEGIGLRHLCDWAVFYASLSEKEFTFLFEEKLKACGLWRFACILTLTCMSYLHAPERVWAGEADEVLLESLISDILNGGNFGKKDEDRYRQIKYISNRGERTIDEKGTLRQVLDTIEKKAEVEEKSKWRVITEYVGMVLRGERKLDQRTTLQEAEKRKKIYQEFHLFTIEERKKEKY